MNKLKSILLAGIIMVSGGAMAYNSVGFSDFMIDYQDLKGEKVSVGGYGQFINNVLVLADSQLGTSFIYVDTRDLDRVDRKNIVENCRAPTAAFIFISGRCDITVSGSSSVSPIGLPVIKAEMINIK